MPNPDLATILSQVMQPGAAPAPTTPAESPLALMMAMMQQQNEIAREQARAAEARAEKEEQRRREDKAETTKMLMALGTLLIPKLLDKPAMDPFVVKMLESSSNKDAMKDFLATSSALNQQSSQMFMQQLATMMGTMGDMQNRMTERQIDMMEERMAKMAERENDDDEEGKSPFADIVKAVMPHLLGDKAAVGTAVVNAATATPATPPATGTAVAVVNPVAKPMPTPLTARKVRLMQLCMALHLRGSTFATDKAAAFKTAIVNTVARCNDVAHAIMTDDSGALLTALAPAVQAEPPLGTWVQTPAAQAFIGQLITETVKPGLLAVAQEMQRRQTAKALDDAGNAQTHTPAEPPVLNPENVAKA